MLKGNVVQTADFTISLGEEQLSVEGEESSTILTENIEDLIFMIDATRVSIRDVNESDFPHILNYWYADPSTVEAMGADPSKLTPKEEFETSLRKKCESNRKLPESKLNVVAICYEDRPVGFHTLNPITEGDCGIFHAHIWDSSMRGQGVGVISYPMACRIFLLRFNLNRILFKTPLQNIGAIRVKEKLKIPFIGEEEVSFGIYKDKTKVRVYEISKEKLAQL